MYSYDTNKILVQPSKIRAGSATTQAYENLFKLLTENGFRPRLKYLDNEASKLPKQFDRNEHVDFQMVPPHIHRCNATEKAIRTWKYHYVEGMFRT